MKYSYNWLQGYFDKKLPEPEKLAELLTMHSFEVEGVEKAGKDYIFDIDILPNRMPDAAGHGGVAKEIAAILNLKLKAKSKKPRLKTKNLKDKLLEIEVEAQNLCPRYIALIMRNIKVGESPKWLKEKLEYLGVNSINNVVDATNYIMLETGQPTHIFDLDKIENVEFPISNFQFPNKLQTSNSKSQKKRIIVRRAKNGEKIATLDNKKYELDDSMLVIADSEGPLAIAGVKGGKKAEVDSNTKNIILESANFNGAAIRKTSKKLNLRTDASNRFSAGLDPNLVKEAGDELAELIQKLAGGEVVGGLADIYPKKAVPTTIKLNFDKVREVLGVKITDKKIKDILKKLNIIQLPNSNFQLPTIRRDLKIEEDLIEEIGRIYGYEKIEPIHPLGELIPPQKNDALAVSKATKNFLIGRGFAEIYSYSFIGDKDLEILEFPAKDNIIELQNPLSPELKFLRPNLLLNVLKSASLNFKNYDNFRFFEIGNVFTPGAEKRHLGGIVADRDLDGQQLFYRIKGILSSLFEALGIDDALFVPLEMGSSPAEFNKAVNPDEIQASLLPVSHPHRLSRIKIGEEAIGVLGEIRPDILSHYDIKRGKLVFFELNFGLLAEKAEEEREFRPFSKFPSVIRDLSLLVPKETRVVEVMNVLETQGGKILADTDLFDIYEDKKFEGKKSLAFRLIFQSSERTLSDEEIDKIMGKIIIALEENTGWEVRK